MTGVIALRCSIDLGRYECVIGISIIAAASIGKYCELIHQMDKDDLENSAILACIESK